MADILIRGMEMPGNNNTVLFCVVDGKMKATSLDRIHDGFHEVIELPKHGRLIDADAIVAEMEKQAIERDKIMELCKRVGDMENYFRCSNNQTEIVSFMRMLNNAPTVVPAEGGEADGN